MDLSEIPLHPNFVQLLTYVVFKSICERITSQYECADTIAIVPSSGTIGAAVPLYLICSLSTYISY